MALRKKKGGFFIKFLLVMTCIAGIFAGGYFFLDKVVVPKHFGRYGIHSMPELVGMMRTLYTSPDENKLVHNGFTDLDLDSAEDKLKNIFPTEENSDSLDYNAIASGTIKEGTELPLVLEFSDQEIASVIDEMLDKGILAKKLPNLAYINTMGIDILELTITPEEIQEGVIDTESADVHAIIKFDTTDARQQMANEMGTSMFVLDMIVPKTIYITLDYHLEISDEGWLYSDGYIGVNGRTSTQSEILMNLLISFIFPVEDEMNLEKITHEFGNILQSGLDLIGKAEYKENGIVITIK